MQISPRQFLGVTLAVCAFVGCSTEQAVAPAPPRPAFFYTGPSTGVKVAPDETTSVTVTVLSKTPLRDFRFIVASTEEVLPNLCPTDPDHCFVAPSQNFPSLQIGSSFDLGTFVGPVQVRLGVIPCRPEQFVNSCSPTNQITTLFQDTQQGITRVGVEAVGAFDYQDLVIEFKTRGHPVPGGVQATLTLARDTVAPVTTGGCFNAVAQTVYTDSTSACAPGLVRVTRRDTTEVTVHGVLTASGAPAAGATVLLAAIPIDTSGNHHTGHGAPRPRGTFFLPGQDVSQDGRPNGDGQIALTLDAQGNGRVKYRSSGVGGREVITAVVSTGSVSSSVRDTLTIMISGLVELLETGSIDTVGVDANHPDTHWGTQTMVDRLRLLGDSLQGHFSIRLRVNDMSLRGGGLLDINEDWRQPHAEHRDGRSADLRTESIDSVPALDAAQRDFVRVRWRRLNNTLSASRALLDHTVIRGDQPHFHVRVP